MINNRTDASKTDINLLNLRTRMLRDLLEGEWQMSHYSCTITIFTMTAKFSRGHWLFFIVNNRTDTWIYNLCDNDAILLASDWSFSHFCLAFFSWFDLILTPPPFCYCKKQIDVSFPCVCPVIDHENWHQFVKFTDPNAARVAWRWMANEQVWVANQNTPPTLSTVLVFTKM